MSPRRISREVPGRVVAEVRRSSIAFGMQVGDARRSRKWSVGELASRAGLSPDMVYRIEAGQAASSESAARVATALGRRLELNLVDPRRREERPNLSRDPVHSAMGELEARHLRKFGFGIGIDEPYQHYQFAGRADLVAWDADARALLHIENRTRFPDFQEMAGAYNSKRAYLAAAIGTRIGVARWASQTHVIAALWSSEVLHALRLRSESFKSICPDGPEAFEAWWNGSPRPAGDTSSVIVLDPLATGRQRPWIGLDDTLVARPRHRGYAEAAIRLSVAAA